MSVPDDQFDREHKVMGLFYLGAVLFTLFAIGRLKTGG